MPHTSYFITDKLSGPLWCIFAYILRAKTKNNNDQSTVNEDDRDKKAKKVTDHNFWLGVRLILMQSTKYWTNHLQSTLSINLLLYLADNNLYFVLREMQID